jgi:Bifunctional DNA primase/polymerase, N-terminal
MEEYNADVGGGVPSFAGLDETNLEGSYQAALDYHRRGFRVTPLVGKEPILKGWQERELDKDELSRHFFDEHNVGIVLGGGSGLVDVDLDNPVAVEVAAHLLPATVTSGREKNPHSHFWFVCQPPPRSRSYSLPKAMAERLGMNAGEATLVELRSTGRQTVVAPSVHPEDGDRYIWHPGVIREVDGDELERLVKDVAVATLLALNWPAEGSRQDFVLPAAGYLGRHMDHERVKVIMEAAASAAEDEEKAKRSRAVRDTLAKLKRR